MGTNLYFEISPGQWPIVYRPEYNVHLCGLQRLHPFDVHKWGNIYQLLEKYGVVNEEKIVQPNEATKEDLLVVHTPEYLKRLQSSCYVARRAYLKPMRYQVGGSILAGKLALERGWAINIGGGFHHCSANKGEGFCVYADITLLITFLFNHYGNKVKKVLIVDLDAHQGNGYERDFKTDNRVFILDVYNREVFPKDKVAKGRIDISVELVRYVRDESYLDKVDLTIQNALRLFKADFIVYNAGTDILRGDVLGHLAISTDGVIKRDEMVFRYARTRDIPIVMLTSGGYTRMSARVIANSILNLLHCRLIQGPVESSPSTITRRSFK